LYLDEEIQVFLSQFFKFFIFLINIKLFFLSDKKLYILRIE